VHFAFIPVFGKKLILKKEWTKSAF